jgi:hypothetical protein
MLDGGKRGSEYQPGRDIITQARQTLCHRGPASPGGVGNKSVAVSQIIHPLQTFPGPGNGLGTNIKNSVQIYEKSLYL